MPFIYLQLVPRHAADSSDYSFSVYYPTISMLLHIMRHVRSIAKLSKPFSRYYFTTSRNVISSLIPIQTSGVHWLWLLRVDLIYESNVCVCFLFHCSLNLIVLNRQLLSSLGIQKKIPEVLCGVNICAYKNILAPWRNTGAITRRENTRTIKCPHDVTAENSSLLY